MLVKPKKKVLAWSDSAITKTGFGVVSKYILGAIHKVGDYDIDHLAINFHGDFVDTSIVPWQQQPAKLLDPKDPHGIKMFARTLAKKDYDIVWVCNDLYVTHQAAEIINKVRQRAVTRGECPPIFIYYYPVDCHVPEDGCDFLKLVNIPVCYTRHGKQETLKTIPDAYGKLKEVPHGVDTEVFSPASPKQAAEWKRQFLGVSPETTMVINVNRNNPRKQMQYSMLAFKEFKKKVPNSIMYMHTAVQDQGGDLIRAVKDLGMSVKDDIVFPVRYSPSNPAPDSVLNSLYNAADIFLTTHLGEGWGMTQTEAMAAGVPVVAPDNTSTPQLLGKNSERGYIYPCRDQIYIDNSGFRKKGLIPDIVDKMVQAYKAGPKWNNPVVQRARKWTEEHDWKIVTKKWVKIFTDAMKMREGKDVTTTIIAEEV